MVLAIAIGGVGILQFLFFRAEQFRLIDQRIESTASLLISSDLSNAELKEFEEAEDIIRDVVGGEKLNQFVIIYNRRGDIVYRSKNSYLLPDNLSVQERWQTIEGEGHFIRVLTVPLTPQQTKAGERRRTIQVGIILDEELLRWRSLGRHIVIYSILILILILLTTITLSQSLLTPLVKLAQYIRYLGSQFDEGQLAKTSPEQFLNMTVKPDSSNDEFGQLVEEARLLHTRMLKGLKKTQTWTAQMAHELKTPLTILRNCLERSGQTQNQEERGQSLREALEEVSHLNTLINGFLEWNTAENFPMSADELHAIRMKNMLEDLVAKVNRQNQDRLQLKGTSDMTVFARPGFVQQAVSNLLLNALKYSPTNSKVIVELKENILNIQDEGAGVPDSVLTNLGQPFNYGNKDNHGFGLGLAWVSTICQKYDWQLSFEKNAIGTEAKIAFPLETESP